MNTTITLGGVEGDEQVSGTGLPLHKYLRACKTFIDTPWKDSLKSAPGALWAQLLGLHTCRQPALF